MTTTPTMDDLVLNLLGACGALEPDADPIRTAQRFACQAAEWPIKFRDLMLALAVAQGGIIRAKMERGLSYERAYADANAWGNIALRSMVEEGQRYSLSLINGGAKTQ
jgi:hypothetical protein